MSIDSKTVEKVAHLARIRVAEAELPHLAGEVGTILNWVEQLSAVDVAGVEPLANVNDENLRRRPDVVNDGNQADAVLANAPARTADFFTVPKVVE